MRFPVEKLRIRILCSSAITRKAPSWESARPLGEATEAIASLPTPALPSTETHKPFPASVETLHPVKPEESVGDGVSEGVKGAEGEREGERVGEEVELPE